MKKYLFAIALCLLGAMGVQAALPSVQLRDINGNTIDTATLSNDGKPFVISFFATWCKPCNRELKAIAEQYADWQDETGMRLIAVSIDEGQNVNKVKPMVDAEGWEYQVLLDPNGDFKRSLGIQMIPYVLVLDGDGNIIDQRSGYTEGSEQHIIDLIRETINK